MAVEVNCAQRGKEFEVGGPRHSTGPDCSARNKTAARHPHYIGAFHLWSSSKSAKDAIDKPPLWSAVRQQPIAVVTHTEQRFPGERRVDRFQSFHRNPILI